MRILLLSAYDADSHAYWRKGLVAQFPEVEWTVLTLPSRYFSWRLRGNSLTWGFSERETLSQDYDVVIATSMTDLSALRGFVPSLAKIPTLVYFHENQFAYPASADQFKSVEPLVLNLYTALSGNLVAFNTEYNRRTFLEGARAFLKKMPDCVPDNIVERIKGRSLVMPVPLANDCFVTQDKPSKTFSIVWNHRWEYDKNPALLLKAIQHLKTLTVDFTLHVVGQQFRSIPKEFTELKAIASDVIGEWGYVASYCDYQKLLANADVVLSTAIHDFQGIAVLEGVAAGACPVVPDRLAYQELFPENCRYAGGEHEAEHLAQHLYRLMQQKALNQPITAPDVSHLAWSSQEAEYEGVLLTLCELLSCEL